MCTQSINENSKKVKAKEERRIMGVCVSLCACEIK